MRLILLLTLHYCLISVQVNGTTYLACSQRFTGHKDSNAVIKLNKKGFESRLNNPELSLTYAQEALALAIELNYRNGEAEAYRTMGIAKYYLNETGNAINNYLSALAIFKGEGNKIRDFVCTWDHAAE